jgi:hypothetical protein
MAVDDTRALPLAVRLEAEYARARSLASLTRETISEAREPIARARVIVASRSETGIGRDQVGADITTWRRPIRC